MKVKVKVAQPCSSLCDPMDCSLPRSSVHGILQSRILEWELFPSPGDLPNPGIELGSPALQADSLPIELSGKNLSLDMLFLIFKNYLFIIYYWPHQAACRILVLQPGIKPAPSPCSGSVESQPLDCQGSPLDTFLNYNKPN